MDPSIVFDYEKYNAGGIWEGLKEYVTNTEFNYIQSIENYNLLWNIEKAFRITKTDLKTRPVHHRLRNRVEAHICICFAAYSVYKEFARLMSIHNITLSTEKVINEIMEISQLCHVLSKSQFGKTKIFNPTQKQTQLLEMKI